MKPSRVNRIIHRWASIAIAIPTLVVLVSGVVLQLKKQSNWIQPATQTGSNQPPQISFSRILEVTKSVPEAEVTSGHLSGAQGLGPHGHSGPTFPEGA